jgi:5-methylcytosine-specific restriction protein B
VAFRPVDAVFVWRYDGAVAFKPIYGRLGEPGYTKDWLLASGQVAPALDAVFGTDGVLDAPVDITFAWPGGTAPGSIRRLAANSPRRTVNWEYNSAPPVLKLGDPAADPLITVRGNPNHAAPADANAELTALQTSAVKPWVVFVRLADDPNVLHVRVYATTPDAARPESAITSLPPSLQELLAGLPGGQAAGRLLPTPIRRASELVTKIFDAYRREANVLLVGPPGTGKTVALEEVRDAYERASAVLMFDPDKPPTEMHAAWAELLGLTAGRKARYVVFHPSYTYEELVAGLAPAPGVGINLEAVPGPLLNLAHWASTPRREAMLVADEFNRGNPAAIFGDTLALLDAGKRALPGEPDTGMYVDRAFTRYPMHVPQEFEQPHAGGDRIPDRVTFPSSLRILAALNSSDRSVAPLDAALRRRFAIIRVGPDYGVLARHYGIAAVALGTPMAAVPTTREGIYELGVRLLASLNGRINVILGEDFLLGHALLWDIEGDTEAALTASLAGAFDEKVVSSLRLAFNDQDAGLAGVLGLPTEPDDTAGNAVAKWVVPDEELQDVALPRLSLTTFADLSPGDVLAGLYELL